MITIAGGTLKLPRCPYCGIAAPLLSDRWTGVTEGSDGQRIWHTYECSVCGGVVLGFAPASNPHKGEVYPRLSLPHEAIPERAREFLRQAQETYFQPAASIAMSGSAIDSILKAKGYKKGTLYERIDQAAADHIITDDMAKWGHQIRLDGNDQRHHAEENAPLPTQADAERCAEFALALAEVMFVLPSRVKRGIEATQKKP
jgi:Domain of unknown function (DUF4145)